MPFHVRLEVRRTLRADTDADSQRHGCVSGKRLQHHSRSFTSSDDIDRGCGSQCSDQARVEQGVLNEAARIGSLERRMQDGMQVVTEVWNGKGQ
jgi:hypothetical protein